MNSHALQLTARLVLQRSFRLFLRPWISIRKSSPSLGRTVALFVVATLAIAPNGLFGSPTAARQSSDSVSIETFPAGSTPIGLAFDGANIWIADWIGNGVIKMRASDGVILGTYGIFEPFFVAWDVASVWVTNDLGQVTKFRGSDLTHEATISLGTSQLGGIIFDGTSIWVAAYAGGASVAKLRVNDGRILGVYPVGQQPNQLAFDGANVWVTNTVDGTVSRLRASDGHLVFTVPAGISPNGIVFDGHDIWVANSYAHTVTKLRLSDGAILATVRVGKNPQQLASDGIHIWVTNYAPDSIVRQLRASDGARQHAVVIGFDPLGILFDGTSVWVGDYARGTVTKITPTPP
jgi:DNA-binding beta-propeller fold protein YncE